MSYTEFKGLQESGTEVTHKRGLQILLTANDEAGGWLSPIVEQANLVCVG